MIDKIIDFFLNLGYVPLIAVAVLAVILIVGKLIENRADKNTLSVEEEYFNSILTGDSPPRSKSRLKEYKEYGLFVMKEEGKKGLCLRDAKGRRVYEAYISGKGEDYEEYTFVNVKKNRSHTNRIGEVKVNDYGVPTFDFDGKDIREFLKNRRISYRVTKINPLLTVCSADMGNGKSAFAKYDTSVTPRTFTVTTNDRELGYVFLLFFSVIKTEK